MVPFIHVKMKEYQPDYINRGIITFGCSLGATHAANLYFRRPDLFNGLLALSGIYDASYGFGSYMDDLVYIDVYKRQSGHSMIGSPILMALR